MILKPQVNKKYAEKKTEQPALADNGFIGKL